MQGAETPAEATLHSLFYLGIHFPPACSAFCRTQSSPDQALVRAPEELMGGGGSRQYPPPPLGIRRPAQRSRGNWKWNSREPEVCLPQGSRGQVRAVALKGHQKPFIAELRGGGWRDLKDCSQSRESFTTGKGISQEARPAPIEGLSSLFKDP